MGTSPGAGQPADYATIGGFQSLLDGQQKALGRDNAQLRPAGSIFARGVQTLLAAVVNLFGGMMLGRWQPIRPEDIVINDGQLEFNQRLDLLAGVNGYCCAYQSLNIYTGKTEAIDPLGWINVWSPEERLLPFNKQLGPAKGAHVGEHGIKFDQEGLWTVYVLARRKNPSSRYDNPSSRMVAHITDESGAEYSTREYQLPRFSSDYSLSSGDQRLSGRTYPNSDFSVSMAFPVVIPAPGYHVAVGVRDTDKTWWLGGTNYATLAVLKHDNRTENPGQTDVPNEPV